MSHPKYEIRTTDQRLPRLAAECRAALELIQETNAERQSYPGRLARITTAEMMTAALTMYREHLCRSLTALGVDWPAAQALASRTRTRNRGAVQAPPIMPDRTSS